MSINPKFIMNVKGKQTGVVLTVKEFNELIEAYEDLQDIAAYEKAKALGSDTVSWEQAKSELRALGKI
jgi:hypothetical protein